MRCFFCRRLLFCILLVFGGCCLSDIGQWKEMFTNQYGVYTVWQTLYTLLDFDRFKPLLILAAAFSCSGGFCEDWNQKYIHAILVRTSVKKYAVSKLLASALSVFAVLCAGILLYAAVLSCFIPLRQPDSAVTGTVWIHTFLMILPFVLGSIFLTLAGQLLSTYIPDKMIAYSSPFLLFYLLSALTFKLPEQFYFLGWISTGLKVDRSIDIPGVFWKFSIFTLLSAGVGVLFYIQIKRRLEHENAH